MTRWSTALQGSESALDLARLVDALQINSTGFVAFAVCDNASARQVLMREIQRRLRGEVQIRRIKLTLAQPCLHEHLNGRPSSVVREAPSRSTQRVGRRAKRSSVPRVAYFVHGSERITDAEAQRQMYSALQIKREAIGRVNRPVILWLTEAGLRDLARRAPDFFAWRGGLYDLRGCRVSERPGSHRGYRLHPRAARAAPATR